MDPPLNDHDTIRIDDSVCEGDTTSFENGTNESSWDFVDKSISTDSSDDDSSIVIIEREIQRQDSTPSSNAESENEETDSYTDVTDSSSDSEKTRTKKSSNAVMPLYTVQRLDTRPKLPASTEWSVVESVLVIMALVQVAYFCVILGINLFNPSQIAQPDSLIIELRANMRSSKSIIDGVYAFQRSLLKHTYRVNDELYAANLIHLRTAIRTPYEFPSPLVTKEWDSILKAPIDDRPICQGETIREQSPSICRNQDNTLLLLMTGEQLKSLFEDTSSFLHDTAHKYERINDDIVNFVLLKTDKKQESNVFAQDCDNFSKNYRPDFCSKKDAAGESCDTQNSIEKSCSGINDEKDELRPSQESPKMKRATKDLLDLMVKFKNDFDYLYKIYAENGDETEADVQEDEEEENEDDDDDEDDDSNDSEEIEKNAIPINETNEAIPEMDVDAKSANAPNGEQVEESTPAEVSSEPTKIGEWLFDMHAAREQLRHYYEHAISGDWILRLGKQRERLRKTKSTKESRKRKEEKSSTGWKAPEKFRRGLRKMASKWKSKFKKMTDNFVHTYEKYVPSNWQLRWSF